MKAKLHEMGIRIRVSAALSNVSLAVPIKLTGKYDCYAASAKGGNGRICSVEAIVGHDAHGEPIVQWIRLSRPSIWALRGWGYDGCECGDLEDNFGEPLTYRDLRRALLVRWMNAPRPTDPITTVSLTGGV